MVARIAAAVNTISTTRGSNAPTPLKGKKNKMENATIIQILITLAVAWYAGMAIIEKKPTKKPMATRRKEQS
jgi:hypothetical protein